MDIHPLLRVMADQRASALILSVGAPPHMRVRGALRPFGSATLTGLEVRSLAYSLMNEHQAAQFESRLEANIAVDMGELGNFRLNAYLQRGHPAAVIRRMEEKIPTIEELGLPGSIAGLVLRDSGLVLVADASVSRLQASLAALIACCNARKVAHIVSIEDPIEYLHGHGRCIVDQREVGTDTHGFATALESSMREAADIVVVGRVDERETAQRAIACAAAGMLCVAGVPAEGVAGCMDLWFSLFPSRERFQALGELARNFCGLVAVRSATATSPPSADWLESNPEVANLLRDGRTEALVSHTRSLGSAGVQAFQPENARIAS